MLRVSLAISLFTAIAFAVPSIAQTNTEPPKPARAGVNGVGMPVCLYCPIPQYTDQARKAHIKAKVVLQTTITTTGKAVDISVVKGPGYGMDERAVEAVKKWRFKPAHDANDKPVDTIVPIEVTFRVN